MDNDEVNKPKMDADNQAAHDSIKDSIYNTVGDVGNAVKEAYSSAAKKGYLGAGPQAEEQEKAFKRGDALKKSNPGRYGK